MTTGTALDDSASAPLTRATYRDVLDAPEHVVAEIIDGTLYTHPRPAPRHATATATSVLGIEIGGPFDRGRGGPGGWRLSRCGCRVSPAPEDAFLALRQASAQHPPGHTPPAGVPPPAAGRERRRHFAAGQALSR